MRLTVLGDDGIRPSTHPQHDAVARPYIRGLLAWAQQWKVKYKTLRYAIEKLVLFDPTLSEARAGAAPQRCAASSLPGAAWSSPARAQKQLARACESRQAGWALTFCCAAAFRRRAWR